MEIYKSGLYLPRLYTPAQHDVGTEQGSAAHPLYINFLELSQLARATCFLLGRR